MVVSLDRAALAARLPPRMAAVLNDTLAYAQHSPLTLIACGTCVAAFSPFLIFAAAVLGVGFICCLPILLTGGTAVAVGYFGPRALEYARYGMGDARSLVKAARSSQLGVRAERTLRANPTAALALLGATPVLIPAMGVGVLAAGLVVTVSLPLLLPGACILLTNGEFRSFVAKSGKSAVDSVRHSSSALLLPAAAESTGGADQLAACPASEDVRLAALLNTAGEAAMAPSSSVHHHSRRHGHRSKHRAAERSTDAALAESGAPSLARESAPREAPVGSPAPDTPQSAADACLPPSPPASAVVVAEDGIVKATAPPTADSTDEQHCH